MKTWMKMFLAVVAVAALAFGVTAYAGTDTYDTPADGTTFVGGLPLCVTFSGTDGGSGNMTVTLPAGFKAKYAWWIESAPASPADGGAANLWVWVTGMTTATLGHSTGTVAFSMTAAADTDDSTSGTFVINDASITDNYSYYGVICR